MIKLLKGDCLELMKDIPNGSIDMILADLPYGTTACKWDTIIPFEPLWMQYKRIIKDNGAIVLTASQPFTSALVMSNIKMFKYEWIWDKVVGANFMNLKNQPFKVHENILIFSKSANFAFNPIRINRTSESLKRDPVGKSRIISQKNRKDKAEHYNNKPINDIILNKDGLKHPISIIKFSKIAKIKRYNSPNKHPTQKPTILFEYLIKTYTNEGDMVLDNVMGSCTTGIACLILKRNFIGMELNDKYFEIAEKRIEEHQRQLTMF